MSLAVAAPSDTLVVRVAALEPGLVWGGATSSPAPRVQLVAQGGDASLRLRVVAPMKGDPPPSAPPGHTDKLWEHEVVELFLAGTGSDYLEVELGPHGHHLVLRLRDVRQERCREPALDVRTAQAQGWWAAETDLPAAWLPSGPLRGLACHVYGAAPRVFAVSSALAGDVPDFHQPSAFPALDWARMSAAAARSALTHGLGAAAKDAFASLIR